MSGGNEGETNAILDPVLEAAMSDLTSLVYDSHVTGFLRPRQLITHFHLDGPTGTGRAASVAMFKHLKHFDVGWDTPALCDWATRRGWAAKDVRLLGEFGDGIQAGARFHTSTVGGAPDRVMASRRIYAPQRAGQFPIEEKVLLHHRCRAPAQRGREKGAVHLALLTRLNRRVSFTARKWAKEEPPHPPSADAVGREVRWRSWWCRYFSRRDQGRDVDLFRIGAPER